jgi:hypothetical protein
MADEHFSREIIVGFFRSQLSRDERRGFVRHLLRQCPRCSGLLREMGERHDFRLLLGALESLAMQADARFGIASSPRRMPWIRTSMG